MRWVTLEGLQCLYMCKCQGVSEIQVTDMLSASGLVKKIFAEDTTYMSTDGVLHTEKGIIQELKTEIFSSSTCVWNVVFPVGLNLKLLNMTGRSGKIVMHYRSQITPRALLFYPKERRTTD